MHSPAPVANRLPTTRLTCAALLLTLALAALPGLAQSDVRQPSPSADMSVEELFEDYLHFAQLGKFDLADAYAQQLLQHPDLDPVELLAIADRNKRSIDTLMLIIGKSSIADSANQVLEVLRRGEFELRKDVARIKSNVAKLGGPPQMEHDAIERLIESGEYAVPWMLQTLQDPDQEKLHARVLAALPKLGRAAVNPLVIALQVDNPVLKAQIIEVLDQMGYVQAVPYLLRIVSDSSETPATRQFAATAVEHIGRARQQKISGSAALWFFGLGEQFYNEHGSVAADPRLPMANVWYWDAEAAFPRAVPVPQRVFGSVMAMRCCEEALRIDPANDAAIALWLAAEFRRAARLGVDVADPEPGAAQENDETRPADYPPSQYFARAAGARYALLVLNRAVKDGDAAVALGAISALRVVAGESSLIGPEDFKQPLVQALQFPDRVVRLRAALALGNALPKTPFSGAELVVPVLTGALSAAGTEQFVVVDSDADNLNRVASELRQLPAKVIAESSFYKAMDRARTEFDGVTAFFLATDIGAPDLATAVQGLRGEFLHAATPVILLAKPQNATLGRDLGAGTGNLAEIRADADLAAIPELLSTVRARTGQTALGQELALDLALETALTLRRIAIDGRTVFNYTTAEPALVAALSAEDEELRIRSAAVLSLIRTSTAQRAIADVALDEAATSTLRLAAFESLAESAKRFGNQQDQARVDRLIEIARTEPDMVMRTAASRALGSLNLADNKASEIIRSFYRG